jgi:hypothetical protein
MSTRFGNGEGTVPVERTAQRAIATFTNYSEAERAIDRLSDEGFPVERTMLVGRNLRYAERVTGRFGWVDALAGGALSGAVVGLLVGWLFAIFDWFDPTIAWGWLIFDGLWFGTLAGSIMGLVSHALTRGRRDFSSIPAMEAQFYDLLVDDEVADEAARILGRPSVASGVSDGGASRTTEAPASGARSSAAVDPPSSSG